MRLDSGDSASFERMAINAKMRSVANKKELTFHATYEAEPSGPVRVIMQGGKLLDSSFDFRKLAPAPNESAPAHSVRQLVAAVKPVVEKRSPRLEA